MATFLIGDMVKLLMKYWAREKYIEGRRFILETFKGI